MRDKRRNKDFFVKKINSSNERLEMFTSKLSRNEVNEDRIGPVKKKMFGIQFYKINSMISAGFTKKELRDELSKSVQYGETIVNYSYFELLQFLSLSILFDLNYSDVQKAISSISEDQLDDELIQLLFSHWNEAIPTNNVRYPEPYVQLSGIQKLNKRDAIELLKDYLENHWYKGHQDMGWYDSHKDPDDMYNVYSGYWSIESAAICKLLNLDDSELQDLEYYPSGLI